MINGSVFLEDSDGALALGWAAPDPLLVCTVEGRADELTELVTLGERAPVWLEQAPITVTVATAASTIPISRQSSRRLVPSVVDDAAFAWLSITPPPSRSAAC